MRGSICRVALSVLLLGGCDVVMPLGGTGGGVQGNDLGLQDLEQVVDGGADAPADAAVPDGPPGDAAWPDQAQLPDQGLPDAPPPDVKPWPDMAPPDVQPWPDMAPPDLPPLPDLTLPDLTPPPDTVPPADLPPGPDAGGTITYTATLAVCSSPQKFDPGFCEKDTDYGLMTVDQLDSTQGIPFYSYIYFQLDGQLVGKTVKTVTLKLKVGSKGNSKADQSGEVWQVSYFDYTTLMTSVPGKKGTAPLAGNLGPVTLGQVVPFGLPTSVATPGAPVYLGIYPVTNDSVDYYNTNQAYSLYPPQLVVTY